MVSSVISEKRNNKTKQKKIHAQFKRMGIWKYIAKNCIKSIFCYYKSHGFIRLAPTRGRAHEHLLCTWVAENKLRKNHWTKKNRIFVSANFSFFSLLFIKFVRNVLLSQVRLKFLSPCFIVRFVVHSFNRAFSIEFSFFGVYISKAVLIYLTHLFAMLRCAIEWIKTMSEDQLLFIAMYTH